MPALGLGLRLKDMKRSGGNKREIDCKTVRFFFLKKIRLEESNSSVRVLRARAREPHTPVGRVRRGK